MTRESSEQCQYLHNMENDKEFLLFMSKLCKFIWIHWSCYYLCNVQHSSAWVNLLV